MSQTIFDKIGVLEDLPEVGAAIAALLFGQNPFVVLMSGEMGAGKTTLTGHILRSKGLSPKIPVTSPTFTVMNEYQINGEWFAHCDLYRLEGRINFEDFGLLDAKKFRGIFLEWPEQAKSLDSLAPTHKLEIKLINAGKARHYQLNSMV